MLKRYFLNCLAAVGIFIGAFAQLVSPVVQTFSVTNEYIEIAVFMYHHVTDNSAIWGKDCISSEEFENDLIFIKQMGYNTVSLSQLYDYVNSDGSLPKNPVVLTFDDGFLSYKTTVEPLLKKYNCRATLAINGEFADNAENRITDNPRFEYLKWSEIAELDCNHTEIAYHSFYSHCLKNKETGRKGMKRLSSESINEYRKYLAEELSLFRSRLEEIHVNTFITAYPYGVYSKETAELLTELDMKVMLTCESGLNYIKRNGDLLSVKRINRPHGVKSEVFLSKYLKLTKEY